MRWRAAGLLFFSGATALVYQTAWLRQLRLIFGASTFATAAVLAIFMAGLGAGSAILGRRADTHQRPLALYGRLELSIAAAAALSQLLLPLVSRIYIAAGGSTYLGIGGATIVRLLLAVVILGAPTFLMGGTLPAAAKAIESTDDVRRREVALLYATNTLGAVTGALLSTFYLLEVLGNRATLLSAAMINAMVGVIAITLGQRIEPRAAQTTQRKLAAPPRFVLFAAGVSGFCFLLMELVWYRMLSPLLGGTTFMFGLILAMALLGIGVGGGIYALGEARRPATIGRFALTCTAEAAVMLVPFALGDRIAVVANFVYPLSYAGFYGSIIIWTTMTFLIVFPAACIAGYQFPLLIALLGEGGEEVGAHVGSAYAWNTAGAIAGSLAGGFGLIPLLSAKGCWIAAAVILMILGAVAALLSLRRGQMGYVVLSLLGCTIVVAESFALGPTAVWTHSGIGAGRAPQPQSRNETHKWVNLTRRTVVWGADGRESNIAIVADEDASFMVNGKADGSARGDAGTQVMGGVLAALFHPNPRTSLVIGLGTGSTAGWLGAIPSMQRVDVVELEPLVLRVAHDLASVNHNVLANPKVHISIADAREVLLTSRDRYDIIFSEPSNPFRAGVASLFTREFYESANARLARGGAFVQWVQAYEIDTATMGTIYRTLASVFPEVETWSGETGDLLLVARREPILYDTAALRARLLTSPYREAVHVAWRTEGLEGVLSHHIGTAELASAIAANARKMNTDDRTAIEFGFARSLGRSAFEPSSFVALSQKRGTLFPQRVRGPVKWGVVLLHRASDPDLDVPPPAVFVAFGAHADFAKKYKEGNLAAALQLWESNHLQPVNSRELSALGDVLAEAGREEATLAASMLRTVEPLEADAIMARLRYKQKRMNEAAALTVRALTNYHADPWPNPLITGRTLDLAVAIASLSRPNAAAIYQTLIHPFAGMQWNDARRYYLFLVGQRMAACSPDAVRALLAMEPNAMWRDNILESRRQCYARTPLASVAQRDYDEFLEESPVKLVK